MKQLVILILIFTLGGCAKFSYLIEQGSGQFKLLFDAKENKKILEDPDIPENYKKKIKLVQIYKSYFYKYWNKKETKIYSKTTILNRKAVSYLVITSPFDQIYANKECFPITGCFPYLGFYKKEKADKYAETKKKEGFTFVRPVYAYSTLGYFTDTILSSFFQYEEFDLAELIFHELFHTIFFLKNEVDLNENLANYFGREMAFEYFKFDELILF